MIQFNTILKKFNKQGEKTGWTYIEVPEKVASKIKPGFKKSYRVKGFLDNYKIERTSLLPMGSGAFIIHINAATSKILGKGKGAQIKVCLEEDKRQVEINKTFLLCLADEPEALKFFNSLPGSHRNYFSKWIESAKTEATKEKRIARAVIALSRKMGYSEMIKMEAKDKLMF
jgi:hypothetical protein